MDFCTFSFSPPSPLRFRIGDFKFVNTPSAALVFGASNCTSSSTSTFPSSTFEVKAERKLDAKPLGILKPYERGWGKILCLLFWTIHTTSAGSFWPRYPGLHLVFALLFLNVWLLVASILPVQKVLVDLYPKTVSARSISPTCFPSILYTGKIACQSSSPPGKST